jgi:hypothetical protein
MCVSACAPLHVQTSACRCEPVPRCEQLRGTAAGSRLRTALVYRIGRRREVTWAHTVGLWLEAVAAQVAALPAVRVCPLRGVIAIPKP